MAKVSHSAKAFTPKQGQYLAFIDAYTRVNRRPPAEWEMQRHFGVSPPSVHQMVLTLERTGLIRRQPGSPRSIEVLVPPEQLPVLEIPNQSVKTSVSRYYLCTEVLTGCAPLGCPALMPVSSSPFGWTALDGQRTYKSRVLDGRFAPF